MPSFVISEVDKSISNNGTTIHEWDAQQAEIVDLDIVGSLAYHDGDEHDLGSEGEIGQHL